jgi:integrase
LIGTGNEKLKKKKEGGDFMGVRVREKPKGSGIWYVFINHQGRRKSKKIGSDIDLAYEVAKKMEARLILGDFKMLNKKRPNSTFREYCQLWLEDCIKQTRRATTHQRYLSMLEHHIGPIIGKIPINEIKRGDVRNALLSISKKGLSKSTVATAKNVLSGTFEYALEEELITNNPTIGVLKKLGLDNRNREPVKPMKPDEVSLFLQTSLKFTKKWYPFFLCAFRTGMRLGELLGLQWGDVDWNSRVIHVQRSFRNGRITKPKNGKTRMVDISEQLYTEMKELFRKRKKEALATGSGEIVETIFHTGGKPTSQNTIRNIWKRMLTKAGIRGMRFHDIRHTYASLLLTKGESPVYVKEQLGHSSIQMTVDIYGHLIPSSNRDAVNSLDDTTPKRNLYAPTKK